MVLAHISARESFQQTIFQTAVENGAAEYGREWYMRYLESCFREQFTRYLLPTLRGFNQATLDASSIGPETVETVYGFLAALAKYLSTYKREYSICEIGDQIVNLTYQNKINLLEGAGSRTNLNKLILVALGWLTMSMPHPIMHANLGSRYEGRGVFINQQDLDDSYDQPLSILLRNFNLFESMLDPPPVYNENGQTHTSQYFLISTICFHTLRKVAKIEIVWTEQLPLHLEFDRKRRTLTLFAFPSVSGLNLLDFSYANIPSLHDCSIAESQMQFLLSMFPKLKG
jgi:hypothetical protein